MSSLLFLLYLPNICWYDRSAFSIIKLIMFCCLCLLV
ncbi:hypothetical protein 2011_scaffold13_00044 [Bacteriophage sp.]|nr:hypothetical protein 2011_scaffold13_00044 [Bacteriophage sp.]